MVKIRTRVGEFECPDGPYAPHTKRWADALINTLKVDELYALVAAIQEEAYKVGVLNGVAKLIGGFDNAFASIVEVSAEEVCEPGELEHLARVAEEADDSAKFGAAGESPSGSGDGVPEPGAGPSNGPLSEEPTVRGEELRPPQPESAN